MKKYLPFMLVGVGIVVIIAVFLIVKNRKPVVVAPVDDTQVKLLDLPVTERPVVSLIPFADGHYLKLRVTRFVKNAATMDYELLYQTDKDITQGVPGEAKLTGDLYEVDLLLGTESSGKFRYDTGVETGSISLKFRDTNKNLMAKYMSDFHMQTGVTTLSSIDDKFSYTLPKVQKGVFYVTMNTVGTSDSLKAFQVKDDYAVFSSQN
jgi:hypothetical protein